MNTEIPIKERAICPKCRKAFRMNSGRLYNGHMMCYDCFKDVKYKTFLKV